MVTSSMTVVLTTGGTIASREGSAGVVATVSGADLVEAVPGLADEGEVEVQDLMNVNAYRLDPGDMLDIARAARATVARPDVGGVVVTHGTDTMEETAYLTDLLVDGEKPVVFTGAQRHGGSPNPDGPTNLLNAVRVARAPTARGLGALIAFEGRVDAARVATKVHTFSLRAFGAIDGGPVGEVGPDGTFRLLSRPARVTNLVGTDAIEPAVALVKLAAGIDGAFINLSVERGMRGIVLEAFGLGNGNDEVLTAVRAAVEAGVVVMVTSRCPSGAVDPVYGNGGGHDLADAGALFAGDLRGPKARMLLMAALGAASPASSPAAVTELLRPHMQAHTTA